MKVLQSSLIAAGIFLTGCGNETSSPAYKYCEKNASFTFEKATESQKTFVKNRIIKACEKALTPCSANDFTNLDKEEKTTDPSVLKDKVSQACFEGIQTFGSNFQAELEAAVKDAPKK